MNRLAVLLAAGAPGKRFALWSLLDRLLIPSGRWFLRRRLNRLIDRVNRRLGAAAAAAAVVVWLVVSGLDLDPRPGLTDIPVYEDAARAVTGGEPARPLVRVRRRRAAFRP